MRLRPVQPILANYRPRALARVARWLRVTPLLLIPLLPAAESRGAARRFDLPADVAEVSLQRFTKQYGRAVLWSPDLVKGVKTNAVHGEWTPAEALEQMLAGTRLIATRDAKSGAFAVGSAAPPLQPGIPAPPRLPLPPPPYSDAAAIAPPDDSFVMSPFLVSTDKDAGYHAVNSLAGTRLDSELRDTAGSVSVFTREFLDDVAITDLSELIGYTVNSETGRQTYRNAIAMQNGSRIVPDVFARGQETTLSLDYFLSPIPTDPYRVSRYEDSRGPNSILFGVGRPGGVLNQTSKTPHLQRDSHMIRQSLGSWDRHRLELEANRVLRRDTLAVMLAAVQQENGGWRDFDFQDKKRIHGAVTFRPHPTLRFTAMGETGRDVSAVPPISVERDWVLAWYDNRQARGVAAVTFAPTNAPPTDAQKALGVTARNGMPAGGNHRATFIENNGTTFDAIGTLRTGSYNDAAVRAPDGQPGVAASAFGLKLNDPSFYPRTLNAHGAGAFRDQRLRNYTIIADWQASPRLAFNLAHNYQNSTATVHFLNTDNPPLQGEPNRTLGIGGPPNPWAGRLYFDGNWKRQMHHNDIRETRLSASYRLEPKSPWLGQHRLGALWSQSTQLDMSENSNLALAGHPFDPLPNGANNQITVRNYLTEGDYSTYRVVDWRSLPSTVTFAGKSYPIMFVNGPADDASNGGGYQDLRSGLAVVQSRFAGGKLVTTFGYRQDRIAGVNLGYDADPIRGHVVNRNRERGKAFPVTTARTGTAGVVYHVFDWLSLLANRSSNQGAKALPVRVFPEGEWAPTRGRGEDYGVGFDLMDGRLNARVVHFAVSGKGGIASTGLVNPAALSTDVMDAFTRVLVGDNRPYSAAQWESIYRAYTPATGMSTVDSNAAGYEAQVTANLTPRWRLVANYSYTNARRTNLGGKIIAWFGLKTDPSGKLLQGVTSDANGRLVLDPRSFQAGGTVAKWIELGAQAPAANPSELQTADGQTVAEEVQSLVESLNTVKAQIEDREGLRPHKLSVFTAYDFKAGWLRGFTVGGGWRWLSADIIGTDSQGRELIGRVRTSADLMLAYLWKPQRPSGRVRFQVNVSNLFNHTPILPMLFTQSPAAPDGFIVPGGRGVAYSRYDLTPPREIRWTTTYSF